MIQGPNGRLQKGYASMEMAQQQQKDMSKAGAQLRKQDNGNRTHLSTDQGRGKVITLDTGSNTLSYE
jgi:hypothetical protein